MISGVYTITAPSGRFYVGSAVNFATRWSIHKHHLKNSTHHNKPLQAAWNKYGDALVFKKIIACSPENTVFYEQLAIDGLKPQMNVCLVAGKTLGYKHTEETRAKFHLRKKATVTEEMKKATSERFKGKKLSPEHAAKTQAAKIGKKKSPEACERMRQRMLGTKRGPHTQETKDKIRNSQIGRAPLKAIAANRGRVVTEEQKAKQRDTWVRKRLERESGK